MNTYMYDHPYTAKHLRAIREELRYVVMGPQSDGKLACGDEGKQKSWYGPADIYQALAR